MNVSVIIPAHNAAKTLAETLNSLLAQTFPAWEAIVVDDGSSDETAAIAATFAAQDPRIHGVGQPQMGVSAARNTGVGLARFEWLLFLDPDDWLLPPHLERLTDTLPSNPTLDAVHCGWAHAAPGGTVVDEHYGPAFANLFPTLARHPAFVMHACLVRRSLVEAIGGFDASFLPCEDWDLWQRIARIGARFGAVREVLALRRMRPYSASLNVRQMHTAGLRIITQGHSADPRVSNPYLAYANGLPIEGLASAKFHFLCWCAGLMLGNGEDARCLVSELLDNHCIDLDPYGVAESLFRAATLPTCRGPSAWIELWPGLVQHIDEFLLALEAQSLAPRLAQRAHTILQRFILEHGDAPRPLTIGKTHSVVIEATEPIPDIFPPQAAERLHCIIELEGTRIGTLEIPVCDGLVPSYILADAIAAEFAWSILGRFFEQTVYRDLSIERKPTGLSIRRGALRLTDALPEDEDGFWLKAHDQIGWTVFLQEIWGRPDWPKACFYWDGWNVFLRAIWARLDWPKAFYSHQLGVETRIRRQVNDGWLVVDVGEDLPEVAVSGRQLNIVMTIGGVALGVVPVHAKRKIVRAQELRAALTAASGFELCRVAVREGLVGKPIAGEPVSLRARLVAAKATRCSESPLAPKTPKHIVLAPGSAYALGHLLSISKECLVLGRRLSGKQGTSASRRATLPAAAVPELIDAASIAGELVFQVPGELARPHQVVYAPDLIWRLPQGTQASATSANNSRGIQSGNLSVYDRHHFERLFASHPDPWQYVSPYEQTKYKQTLALLPSTQIGRALELACAEGHFTVQLAPRVGSLIAADISQTALSRAAQRCASLENVRFMHLDLTKDPLPGRFELIVCSEVLYFVGGRKALQAIASKLVAALEPGGYLLTAHANLVVDEPDRPGFDWDLPFGAKRIGEVLAGTRPLRLVKEIRTPLYRIQLFQRDAALRRPLRRNAPEVIEHAQLTPLPPHVAAHVLWYGSGNRRHYAARTLVTERLPILMYHRIAATSSPVMARYRVTPEAFEMQLRYLRDAGFYSAKLEDWHAAMETKQPLPGRAVIITFDDGYLDFLTDAWPLLKYYGFSATVFLVADEVGGSNRWDRMTGEEVPLLGWKDIRRLQDEGVEFGSHSATHRPLTALALAEIVREGARARAILQRELHRPITAFAYPYGDVDRVVQHLIGACGYVYGLSTRSALSSFDDPLLNLPRIGIAGSDSFQQFVARLTP